MLWSLHTSVYLIDLQQTPSHEQRHSLSWKSLISRVLHAHNKGLYGCLQMLCFSHHSWVAMLDATSPGMLSLIDTSRFLHAIQRQEDDCAWSAYFITMGKLHIQLVIWVSLCIWQDDQYYWIYSNEALQKRYPGLPTMHFSVSVLFFLYVTLDLENKWKQNWMDTAQLLDHWKYASSFAYNSCSLFSIKMIFFYNLILRGTVTCNLLQYVLGKSKYVLCLYLIT